MLRKHTYHLLIIAAVFLMSNSNRPKGQDIQFSQFYAASTGKPLKARITIRDYETKKMRALHKSNSLTGRFLVIVPPGKKLIMKDLKTLDKRIILKPTN